MESWPPVVKRHWPLAAVAVLFGLYGWALVIATGTGHDGAIGPQFNALGADWVIFLAAARAVFSHDLSHIYDQAWITSATNSQFAYWLSSPLPFPLFPYPPVYLLLVVPFAALPVGWSLFLSQLAMFAVLAWALRKLAPDKSWLFFLAGALLAPAASNNVVTPDGQAFLDARKSEVAALMARLAEMASERARFDNVPVRRAMMNLRAVLMHRLGEEAVKPEILHAVTAIIDDAAQRIERL